MTTRLDLLEKLSAKLREFKPNGLKFSMNFWKREEMVKPTYSEPPQCQTSCCAMGLGMLTIPEFLDVFRFVEQDPNPEDTLWEIVLKDNNDDPKEFRGNEYLVGQLATGFGITADEATTLFMPHSYADSPIYPTDVADRIDTLIKDYSNPDKVFPTFAVYI